MRLYKKILLAIATVALAACGSNGLFGGSNSPPTTQESSQPSAADVQALTSALRAHTTALQEAEPSADRTEDVNEEDTEVEDRAGDVQGTGGFHVSGEIQQCINTHFTDIPRGPDPRHPVVTSEVTTAMEGLVKTTVERMCAPGYTGTLTVNRVCSEDVEGVCIGTTPRS